MTTAAYTYSTTLSVVSCAECGIPFGIPDDFHRARFQDGGRFYCPNGHFVGWTETENAKLKRQLKWAEDQAAAARAERDQAAASRRAWKGQATKLRNRTLLGECPFCGQHLRDLSRHLARRHPDEAAADANAEPVA